MDKAICPSDARVTYAVLVEAGQRKLHEAACSHVRAITAVFEERYSEDEIETLIELLGRLPGTGGGCDVEAEADSCTP